VYVLVLPGLLGSLIGQIYANETLTPAVLMGGGLIVAANVLMQWKRKSHPPAVAPVQ
jgi:hypothetical protein